MPRLPSKPDTAFPLSRRDFLSALLVAAAAPAFGQSATKDSIPLMIAETRDEYGRLAPIRPENQKILNYFERALNQPFDIQRYPLQRIAEQLRQSGGLAFGLTKTSERLQYMKFSDPVFSDYIWVVSRSDSDLEYTNLQDLKNKSVGIARGVRLGDDIDQHRNILFKAEEDPAQLSARLKKLLSGRMDCMLLNSRHSSAKELENELNQYLLDKKILDPNEDVYKVKVSAKPLITDDLHFATGTQHASNLLQRINIAIAKGRQSGELPALVKN